MNNLYRKIYKAVNEGVIKSLHINDENNDNVTYQHNKIKSKVNVLNYYVSEILNNNDPVDNYYDILKYSKISNLQYKVWNYTDLKKLIKSLIHNVSNEIDLNWIDVSSITDMHGLFSDMFDDNGNSLEKNELGITTQIQKTGLSMFKGNISKWNVSNVTDMSYMFYGCTEFDNSLNDWDVSHVTNMAYMFYECSNFNQPLDKWKNKISQVTDMSYMFRECKKFKYDMSDWKIRYKNTNFEGMIRDSGIDNDHMPTIIFEK